MSTFLIYTEFGPTRSMPKKSGPIAIKKITVRPNGLHSARRVGYALTDGISSGAFLVVSNTIVGREGRALREELRNLVQERLVVAHEIVLSFVLITGILSEVTIDASKGTEVKWEDLCNTIPKLALNECIILRKTWVG